MGKLKDGQSGFSAVEGILILVIVVLIGVVGFMVFKNHSKTKPTPVAGTTTKSSSATTPAKITTTPDPYAGWQTYSNSQVSFKYPSDWKTSNGPGNSQSTVADATSPAFLSSAVTASQNAGAQITDYLQLSTDSSTIGCAYTPCTVSAVTPISNSQLPNAVLALVNQTSGNGTNFTEWVVASSATKVGDTSVSTVKAGSNSIYVFGQAYYTPQGGGLTVAARVNNPVAFQADSHYQDLVNLVNSVQFK